MAAPQRLVRAFGLVILVAGLVTLVRAALAGVVVASGAPGVAAVAAGAAILVRQERVTVAQIGWISAALTLLVGAAVASRPVPYGAGYVYVWIAPFAFIAGKRAAAAMTALAGATLAGAFVAQAARTEDPLAFKTYVSWWLVCIGSVLAVGLITRGLATLLLATQEQLERGFRQGVLGMAFLDPAGRWQRVNPALAELLGREPAELAGVLPATVTHPEDHDVTAEWTREAQVKERICFEKRYLRPDGEVRWVAVRAARLLDARGALSGYFAEYEDVTARKVAEDARRAAERRGAALAALGGQALAAGALPELLEDAAHIVAGTLGVPYGTILDVDGLGVLAGSGWDGTAARGHAAAVLDAPGAVVLDDLAGVPAGMDATALVQAGVATGAAVPVRGEREAPFAILAVHSPLATRRFDADEVAFLRSAANVLTAAVRREAAERELRHRSLHDPLTSLANRALLVDRLRSAVPRARREDRTLAVLVLDVDDFKDVNDRHGHDGGDELLRALAPRLQGALRASDTLARLGADEFVALCEGLEDPEEALAVAERLLAAVAAPLAVGGEELRCAASVGIALAGAEDDGDAEDLLRDADLAMHRAKAAGKGDYEVFEHAMRTVALQRVALTNDLDRALQRDELLLHFQPIVAIDTGRVSGAESLVRWRHPEHGLVMPDAFIGLAERTGRIVELGRYVLGEAARHAAQWPDLKVSVNVSRRQLGDPCLVSDVAAVLAAHGVAPGRFCVEVTETALMDDPARAADVLQALRDLGVRIALDDFGTGYSSLSSLSEFPLHTLKLDRAFLPVAGGGQERWSIVRAVLDMARALRLEVVAEGIETAVQRDELARLGCAYGQGYLFSRPVPADALPALVSTSASSPVGAPPR